MSEFELIVIPISVVLGIGMTRILGGIIFGIRHREEVSLHWLPIAWGCFIFMYIMTFFFVLWEVNQDNEAWTWPIFGMQLFYAVVLFLSAGLILPSDQKASEVGMLTSFERHGRIALIPLAVSFGAAIPFNKWGGGPDWISPQNFMSLVLLVLTVVVYRARSELWRVIGTVAFGAVSAFGWFVFFAGPGG